MYLIVKIKLIGNLSAPLWQSKEFWEFLGWRGRGERLICSWLSLAPCTKHASCKPMVAWPYFSRQWPNVTIDLWQSALLSTGSTSHENSGTEGKVVVTVTQWLQAWDVKTATEGLTPCLRYFPPTEILYNMIVCILLLVYHSFFFSHDLSLLLSSSITPGSSKFFSLCSAQQTQLSSTPAQEQLRFTFAYANWSEWGRSEEALI